MIIEQTILGDHRGNLVAIEGNDDVPFDIKRVFYIYGVDKNILRGVHAHYETKQYLIAISGSCQIILDNGSKKETFKLNSKHKGLLQKEMIWGTIFNFSDDCVLLVLASENYRSSDYINDYSEFVSKVQK